MLGRVRVKSAQDAWVELGTARDRGIFPASIRPTWDGWGPLSLTFSLARDPSKVHPDIAAGTPIEYLPPGGGDEPAWGGTIIDTPAEGEEGLTVNARGYSFLLDDDPYDRIYAFSDLSKAVDTRTSLSEDLTVNMQAGTINNDGGGIVLGWPQGAVVSNPRRVGVTFDLGDTRAKRIIVDYQGSPTADSNFRLGLMACDVDFNWGLIAAQYEAPAVITHTAGAVGTYRFTATTARRYVGIFAEHIFTGTLGFPVWWRIKRILVVPDTAYESGDFSVLKASDILKYALSTVPALDQATGEITTTATSLPTFGDGGDRTAREDCEKANSFHRYVMRFSSRGRLQFRPRFGAPTLEANTRRPGVDWNDATVNSLEDVYNKVVVRATGAGGVPLTVTRRSSDVGIRNVLDRLGRTRTKVLQVASRSDTATMTVLADAWLNRYARTPLKGTLVLTGNALRDLQGASVPASMVGTRVGELASLANLIDPDTGAMGRVAITVGASYDEDADQATVDIDNTRDDIDALLARMAVVQGS